MIHLQVYLWPSSLTTDSIHIPTNTIDALTLKLLTSVIFNILDTSTIWLCSKHCCQIICYEKNSDLYFSSIIFSELYCYQIMYIEYTYLEISICICIFVYVYLHIVWFINISIPNYLSYSAFVHVAIIWGLSPKKSWFNSKFSSSSILLMDPML